MKSFSYLRTLHNGKYDTFKGYRGQVRTAEEFEQLVKGEIDWKDHIKPQLRSVEIPAEVFFKLLEKERNNDSRQETEHG